MADDYVLRVTAGTGYEKSSHEEVKVNQPRPTRISSKDMDIDLWVRIKNYRGLPDGSPPMSPYFTTEPHAANNDQFSIAIRFTPKEDIRGDDLQFGNDLDHPLPRLLPSGLVNTALAILRWSVDPGLEGDPYAEKPYLYGAALSSFNCLYVGDPENHSAKGGGESEAKGELYFDEGGDEAGMQARQALGMPETSRARQKWALQGDHKTRWSFNKGTTYCLDFFTPYLEISSFSVRLPGFHLPVMQYWDGQSLRYVLRNRSSGDVYLAVLLTPIPRTQLNAVNEIDT